MAPARTAGLRATMRAPRVSASVRRVARRVCVGGRDDGGWGKLGEQAREEVGFHGAGNEDPAGSDAGRAGVQAQAIGERGGNDGQVGAGQDEDGVDAGELHGGGRQGLGRDARDRAAGFSAAGEDDVIVAGAEGGRAGVFGEDVEHVVGQAGFGEEGGQSEHRGAPAGSGLDRDAVAGG